MRRFLLILCVLTLLLASFAPTFAQDYGQTIHIVERGETLAVIARMYNVSVQAIAQANGIWNPNILYAGQRLVIPSNVGYPPPPQHPPRHNYYMVRWGDTLVSIARYFGVSPWSIAQANHIYNLNQIYTGMYLVIPSGGYPPPQQPPPHHGHHAITYRVKPGDTLASIAWHFGTTVNAIAQANGIQNPNYIYWGMILNIPTNNR